MYNSLPRPLSCHEDGGDEPHGTENMPGFDVKENREHVRASISAVVRFSVMSPAEYNSTKASKERNSPGMPRTNDKPFSSLTEASFCKTCEPYLSGLLLRIDEKLDRILDIVSEGEDREEKTEKGKALDISGTGMTLLSEKEYQVGDILKTDFRVPGTPPVWLELYGEIVRVLPVSRGEEKACEIALSFIDLRGEDREKIVYYAFQRQRETIRSMKEKK